MNVCYVEIAVNSLYLTLSLTPGVEWVVDNMRTI